RHPASPGRAIARQHHASSAPFPYTTLFRSCEEAVLEVRRVVWPRRQHDRTRILGMQGGHRAQRLREPRWIVIDAMDARSVEHARSESTRLNSSHLVISYAVFCLKNTKAHCR